MASLYWNDNLSLRIFGLFCIWMMISTKNTAVAVKPIHATEYPVDTSVIVGDNVEFKCTVDEPATGSQILAWYIEWDNDTEPIRIIGAQTQTTVSATDRPEFIVRGVYSTTYSIHVYDGRNIHSCTLKIMQTTLNDNGFFGCTHQNNTPDAKHRTLLQEKIRLTVVPVPTHNPECTVYEAQKIYILTCVPKDRGSQATLTWFEDNQQRSDIKTTINTIEVPADSFSSELVFQCRAELDSQPVKTCHITLTPTITLPSTTRTTTIPLSARTTEHYSTTVKQKPLSTNSNGGIIAAVLITLFLLILILLLLLLLFYRRRKQKREPENTVEMAPPPELPTLEPPTETVANPYGDVVAGPSGAQAEPDSDFDELEKPWKRDPNLLMGLENDAFDEVEISDADSATESYLEPNAIDDQPYENYMTP